METGWDIVVDGLGKLEAPCIDSTGALVFTDMAGDGTVYRLDESGSLESIATGRPHVGGIAVHAGGGFVIAGATVSVLDEGNERVLMRPDGGWGFNDLTTDTLGNVFVGLHGERPTKSPPSIDASLWRISSTGEITRCYGGIQQTNGVGISPDGKHLYHNDTLPGIVWISDVDDGGLPVRRRLFHKVRYGMPDGMAIDESGGIWLAVIGAGKIVRLTPAGDEDLVLDVPMPWVSALCFGGSDHRDLFVTTFGLPYDTDHTGSVIRMRSPIPGLPRSPACV